MTMNAMTEVPDGHGTSQPGGTDKPALGELLRQLKLAHRQAGNPSYRTITGSTTTWLSTSTISRIFNAKKPPKWENLTVLLLAIGVAREEIETTWHRRWMLAVNEANPLTSADDAAGELLPAGRRPTRVKVCPLCGSWIGDSDLHVRWHQSLARTEPSAADATASALRRRR